MNLSLLEQLPPELLEHLFSFLDLSSLLSLSSTSSSLHSLISPHYLEYFSKHLLNYSPHTLSHLPFHRLSPWSHRALWTSAVERNFTSLHFRAHVLGGPQRTYPKCLPCVKLWHAAQGQGEVLIARGGGIETWLADRDGAMRGADVLVEGVNGRAKDGPAGAGALEDITALADGLSAGEVTLARVNGLVQRLRVRADHRAQGGPVVLREVARYASPAAGKRAGSTTVQALSSAGGLLARAGTTRLRPPAIGEGGTATPKGDDPSTLSLAQSLAQRAAPKSHFVSVQALASPWVPPTTLPFSTKPWSVLVQPSASPSWLAVGHSGTSPLALVPLLPSGPLTAPNAWQHLAPSTYRTSVYGLCTPSAQCSPFPSNPEQTLIAAFYDSTTRVYDLRLPSSSVSSPLGSPDAGILADPHAPNEVLRLADPWSDDPSYSVTTGGSAGATIFTGSARNAALRIFDVRSPARSMTAFAPGRDRSPIYGLAGEGSRVWGVTDVRGFGMDWYPWARGERVAFVGHGGRGEGSGGGGGELRWSCGEGKA
ncbi:hypothetical protein JCM10207_007308 [Rhodosporidiobolus poonsookiae]